MFWKKKDPQQEKITFPTKQQIQDILEQRIQKPIIMSMFRYRQTTLTENYRPSHVYYDDYDNFIKTDYDALALEMSFYFSTANNIATIHVTIGKALKKPFTQQHLDSFIQECLKLDTGRLSIDDFFITNVCLRKFNPQ